jgi:hypothetical protein
MNNGRIIKYGVIVQNYHGGIVANVQALIDKGEGWQPLGGIEITINGQFAQAVAQYDTLETTIDPSAKEYGFAPVNPDPLDAT